MSFWLFSSNCTSPTWAQRSNKVFTYVTSLVGVKEESCAYDFTNSGGLMEKNIKILYSQHNQAFTKCLKSWRVWFSSKFIALFVQVAVDFPAAVKIPKEIANTSAHIYMKQSDQHASEPEPKQSGTVCSPCWRKIRMIMESKSPTPTISVSVLSPFSRCRVHSVL